MREEAGGTLVDLSNLDVGDEVCSLIGAVPRLVRELRLGGTRVGDITAERVADLKGLEWLELSDTGVTTSGLRFLQSLPRLRTLYLIGTLIGDEAVPVLGGFPALRKLGIEGTEISEQGYLRLLELVPDVVVEY